MVEKSTARAEGSSASEPTSTPVSIRPPKLRSSEARLEVMAHDPPAAIGQPIRCPAAINTNPTAAVKGRSSLAMA